MAKARSRKRRGGRTVRQSTPYQVVQRWTNLIDADSDDVLVSDAYRRSAWAFGAISLIAETIANVPFAVFDNDREVHGGPLNKLISQPNDYPQQNTCTKQRQMYFVLLLLHGGVMRLFPEINGVEPLKMLIEPRRKFRPLWYYDEYGRQVVSRWILSGPKAITYINGDDAHYDVLSNPYHDYEGLAPLEAALLGLNNDIGIGKFTKAYFRNDGSTGIIFTSDNKAFHQKQAEEAAKRYHETEAGTDRAFRARFLGYGLTPHKIGSEFDAEAMEILRTLTKEEIVTGIYKIPLEMFGSREKSSGVTISSGASRQATAHETYIVNVAMPWAKRYDEEFNRTVTWRFGPNLIAKHDFTNHPVLERRRLERAQAAAELIDRGIPLNEVIRWLRLEVEPQVHGDEWWVDNTKVPASVIMKAGDKALPANQSDQIDKHRAESVAEYVNSIVQLAQAVKTIEQARSANRGAAKSNHQRILEVIGHVD